MGGRSSVGNIPWAPAAFRSRCHSRSNATNTMSRWEDWWVSRWMCFGTQGQRLLGLATVPGSL
jgi:hypothetical protein